MLRIPLTLTVLGYALVTIKADFNKTHATNPAWTPHPRFHVVCHLDAPGGRLRIEESLFALCARKAAWESLFGLIHDRLSGEEARLEMAKKGQIRAVLSREAVTTRRPSTTAPRGWN